MWFKGRLVKTNTVELTWDEGRQREDSAAAAAAGEMYIG